MEKYLVLYNPKSANNNGLTLAKDVELYIDRYNITYIDITTIKDYKEFMDSTNDNIIICGGDGTLNRFVNNIKDINIKNNIMYFNTGTGNDFYNDVKKVKKSRPFNINAYIQNLPIVEVNGKQYLFINNVAFGLDGYCCEEADRIKEQTNKKANYISIAAKGLFKTYNPTNATVLANGNIKEYNNVWMAPTMNGRYYGGGIKIAPEQDRMNKDVSLIVIHDCNRIQAILLFILATMGLHTKIKNKVDVIKSDDIEVEFKDRKAVQIDGETIKNVKSYKVKSLKK